MTKRIKPANSPQWLETQKPITDDILPITKHPHYVPDEINPVIDGYYLVDKTGRRLTTVLPDNLCIEMRQDIMEARSARLIKSKEDGHQGKLLCKITLPVNPPSKKNGMQFIKSSYGGFHAIPNQPYIRAEKSIMKLGASIIDFKADKLIFPIDDLVRITCHYYRDSHRKIDGTNLESAMADILVKAGVIADDDIKHMHNSDGRRVFYDKENARTEIFIYKWIEGKA